MHSFDLYHLDKQQLARLSKEELFAAYQLLYREVLASREAAAITARLVVAQIAKVEEANQSLELANEELRKLTNLDGLTGIANRRYHEDKLHREWRRCQRTNSSLAAIMIDIDQFKKFNDHYGHVAGDQCLREVATALQKGMRRVSDSLARYGGEEFICLLPDCSAEAAYKVAELFHQRIDQLKIPHATSQVAPILTVSQGVAAMVPSRDSKASELIRQADQALYHAKMLGRNRVVIYDATGPHLEGQYGNDSN
ncbi:diguanylate cyclase [Desulfobulbus propionicus DSM 2032]|jgi:diguanylate cyclase (GGDEF)-like protein|uniref:diguanylate cyclase n=1 Tax=Desulfobulbus propionicus (strain ATCC 33891 / DSM 2032 / VKM B-1956 / 1pr3) TaxID=577650 RepID=A0A7U3YM67_DESPD|nr:diguanylate cyclase [Desulfobulbus propionicus]ADW17935.1 diguanylate cyclase [Desulfobulbus propionicus DSM 2032]